MSNHKKIVNLIIQLLKKNYLLILLLIIFLFHIFFRFYQLEERFTFSFDQVDNAWAARSIILDKEYPMLGMVAKNNTGFYIGPIYYYYVAFFYYFTNLHPIASAYIAGFTSIITFFTLYFVIKKIFNEKVALIAVFIHTFSVFLIVWDRNQWPVNFIAPVSALIFYSLFKIMTKSPRYIFLLAALVGLSFHVHFTSVFYLLIIFLTLPLWPRTKEALKNIILGISIFLILVSPIIIANSKNNNSNAGNLTNYLMTYYHGFHLRRIMQLAGDALIEIGLILQVKEFSFLKFLLIPIFYIIYLYRKVTLEKKIISYLIALWIIIPWIVFSLYSGEISNYYFSITRPVALMVLSFITYKAIFQKYKIFSLAMIVFWIFYSYLNIYQFFQIKNTGLKLFEYNTIERVKRDQSFIFKVGDPESYFNFYYIEKLKSTGKL